MKAIQLLSYVTTSLLVSLPLPVVAATWYVDAAAGDRGDGSLRAPWADLQAAIDRAGVGGHDPESPRGTYRAHPEPFTEDTLRQLSEHRTEVAAARFSDRRIRRSHRGRRAPT